MYIYIRAAEGRDSSRPFYVAVGGGIVHDVAGLGVAVASWTIAIILYLYTSLVFNGPAG